MELAPHHSTSHRALASLSSLSVPLPITATSGPTLPQATLSASPAQTQPTVFIGHTAHSNRMRYAAATPAQLSAGIWPSQSSPSDAKGSWLPACLRASTLQWSMPLWPGPHHAGVGQHGTASTNGAALTTTWCASPTCNGGVKLIRAMAPHTSYDMHGYMASISMQSSRLPSSPPAFHQHAPAAVRNNIQ